MMPYELYVNIPKYDTWQYIKHVYDYEMWDSIYKVYEGTGYKRWVIFPTPRLTGVISSVISMDGVMEHEHEFLMVDVNEDYFAWKLRS